MLPLTLAALFLKGTLSEYEPSLDAMFYNCRLEVCITRAPFWGGCATQAGIQHVLLSSPLLHMGMEGQCRDANFFSPRLFSLNARVLISPHTHISTNYRNIHNRFSDNT